MGFKERLKIYKNNLVHQMNRIRVLPKIPKVSPQVFSVLAKASVGTAFLGIAFILKKISGNSIESHQSEYHLQPLSMTGFLEGAGHALIVGSVADATFMLLLFRYHVQKKRKMITTVEEIEATIVANRIQQEKGNKEGIKPAKHKYALDKDIVNLGKERNRINNLLQNPKVLEKETREQVVQVLTVAKKSFNLFSSGFLLISLLDVSWIGYTTWESGTYFDSLSQGLKDYEQAVFGDSPFSFYVYSPKVARFLAVLLAIYHVQSLFKKQNDSEENFETMPISGLISGAYYFYNSQVILIKSERIAKLIKLDKKSLLSNQFLSKLKLTKYDYYQDALKRYQSKEQALQALLVYEKGLDAALFDGIERATSSQAILLRVSSALEFCGRYRFFNEAFAIVENIFIIRERQQARMRELEQQASLVSKRIRPRPIFFAYETATIQAVRYQETLSHFPEAPLPNPDKKKIPKKLEAPSAPAVRTALSPTQDPIPNEVERELYKPENKERLEKLALINTWRTMRIIKKRLVETELERLANFLPNGKITKSSGNRRHLTWETIEQNFSYEEPHYPHIGYSGYFKQCALDILEIGWLWRAPGNVIEGHIKARPTLSRLEFVSETLQYVAVIMQDALIERQRVKM